MKNPLLVRADEVRTLQRHRGEAGTGEVHLYHAGISSSTAVVRDLPDVPSTRWRLSEETFDPAADVGLDRETLRMRLPGVARTAPAATGRMSNKTGEPASCRKTTTTTRPAEGWRHHPRRHRGAGRTSTPTRPRTGAQRHAAERGASRHGNAGPIAGPAGKGGGSTAHGKQPEAAHIPTCSPRGGQMPSRRNNRQRAQLSHSPREAKRADDTVRTEPRLGAGTVQPCRYVWIDRDAAHGGHRGAGVNTVYVDPQKGKMLPAAALAAAAESYALDGPGQIPLAGSRGQPHSYTEVHKKLATPSFRVALAACV